MRQCLLIFLFFLSACQAEQNQKFISASETTVESRDLSTDNGRLDLSQSSLDQQKIERKLAAESLLAARNERVIIQIDEKNFEKSEVNIASFARNSLFKINEKNFKRLISLKFNSIIECSKFANSDDAQRYFLTNGGPHENPNNLDPDGDGFACQWDPKIFRMIEVPPD